MKNLTGRPLEVVSTNEYRYNEFDAQPTKFTLYNIALDKNTKIPSLRMKTAVPLLIGDSVKSGIPKWESVYASSPILPTAQEYQQRLQLSEVSPSVQREIGNVFKSVKNDYTVIRTSTRIPIVAVKANSPVEITRQIKTLPARVVMQPKKQEWKLKSKQVNQL